MFILTSVLEDVTLMMGTDLSPKRSLLNFNTFDQSFPKCAPRIHGLSGNPWIHCCSGYCGVRRFVKSIRRTSLIGDAFILYDRKISNWEHPVRTKLAPVSSVKIKSCNTCDWYVFVAIENHL